MEVKLVLSHLSHDRKWEGLSIVKNERLSVDLIVGVDQLSKKAHIVFPIKASDSIPMQTLRDAFCVESIHCSPGAEKMVAITDTDGSVLLYYWKEGIDSSM